MSYVEEVKLRILSGDLSKPDELYPMLVEEIHNSKKEVKDYLHKYLSTLDNGYSILDVGGANGDMISSLKGRKAVIDKRKPTHKYPDIVYYQRKYVDDDSRDMDYVVFSEFLHLFSIPDIMEILGNCKAKNIVVIENNFDDFLDLRLRLWSKGRCIEPSVISHILGVLPEEKDHYLIWIKENNK